MGEVDDRHGRGASRGDRNRLRRRRRRACRVLRRVDVVDNGEIGRLGVVGHRNPYRRERGIVGEADMKVGMPGAEAIWTVSAPSAMQGWDDGKSSMRARIATAIKGTT